VVLQAHAAMIGDSPAADARSRHPAPDKHAGASRQGAAQLGRAPLAQPGDDYETADWLCAVLGHVRWFHVCWLMAVLSGAVNGSVHIRLASTSECHP